MRNLHQLEIVGHTREPRLEVGENSNLRLNQVGICHGRLYTTKTRRHHGTDDVTVDFITRQGTFCQMSLTLIHLP